MTYFDKPEEQIKATILHEFAHHIINQTSRNPSISISLINMWKKEGGGKYSATIYAEIKDEKEWFSENYALAKMGLTDLVDKSIALRLILKEIGAIL